MGDRFVGFLSLLGYGFESPPDPSFQRARVFYLVAMKLLQVGSSLDALWGALLLLMSVWLLI